MPPSLQVQVATGRRYYWLAHIGLLGAAVGAVRLLAPRAMPPAPVATAAAAAPAPITIVVPTPVVVTAPSAPPAAPAPIISPAPIVLHTACAADRSAIGIPIDSNTADSGVPGAPSTAPERRAATSPDGCTIATWTADMLAISWDGGQTFTSYGVTYGSVASVAVTAGRVVVLTDQVALGVAHTGEPDLTWREPDPQIGAVVALAVMATGDWTVAILDRDGRKIAALSADDGATWTYAPAPTARAMFTGLDDAGRLTASELHDDRCWTARWSTDLAHLDWHRQSDTAGNLLGAGAWAFSLLADGHTSCDVGGNLVARRAGQTVALGAASTDDFHLATRGDTAFVYVPFSNRILRVVNGRVTTLPRIDAQVRDVDARGDLIAVSAERVYRWSPRGGWRQLWSEPDDDGD